MLFIMKIVVSQNLEVVKLIREGLKRTGGYCPCLIEKNEDTKCLCKAFREQTTLGPCHCGLYEKVE